MFTRRTVQVIAISVIAICCGCMNTHDLVNRGLQADETAPYFEDLIFPQYVTTLSEGELTISGTLVDDVGFDPDKPVTLEFTVKPYPSQPEYDMSWLFKCNGGETTDYSFFDFNTGEFRIQLGPERRLKAGEYHLKLTGMDSSGNTTPAAVALVYSTDIEGGDLDELRSSRISYGQNLMNILTAIKNSLAVYGNEYSDDIVIIDYMIQFVYNTWVTNPKIGKWGPYIDQFYNQVINCSYPDSEIKSAMTSAVTAFRDECYENIKIVSKPFYPKRMTSSEILASREKTPILYSEIYDIHTSTTQTGVMETSITVDSYLTIPVYSDFGEQPVRIIDMVISSHPEYPLDIEGYFFNEIDYHYIDPEDFDPPIKLFFAMYESGIVSDALLKIR